MGTSMHRLQISLPEWQVRFLLERARAEGQSMAEIIRRLIKEETESQASQPDVDSLWEIAGMAEDHEPLEANLAVSERPEQYLYQCISPKTQQSRGPCAAF